MNTFLTIVVAILGVFIGLMVSAAVLTFGWNLAMVPVFGFKTIGFLQALGMIIVSSSIGAAFNMLAVSSNHK
jgi:hypothetical protein